MAGEREYWREIGEAPGAATRREFPDGAEGPPEGVSRRGFVKLLGAAAALAGATACQAPTERILPYVRRPRQVTPGRPLHFATAMVLDGYATGLVVESHAGRPTKVEGNPEHPASLGAAGVFEQASVLQLYDPDRAKRVLHRGRGSSWEEFVRAVGPDGAAAPAPETAAGSSPRSRVPASPRPSVAPRPHIAASPRRAVPPRRPLRVLLEPTSSPLLGELLARLRAAHPDARVTTYAPLAGTAPVDGARLVLGRPLLPQYDFRQAAVVVALDADCLASGPFHLRHARHFAERRRPGAAEMSRLYVAECALSPTGAMADARLPAPAGRIPAVLLGLAAELGAAGVALPADAGRLAGAARSGARVRAWARRAAADLRAHVGRSLILVGERQPAEAHALAYLLNGALGNVGRTVAFTESPLVGFGDAALPLPELAAELRAGEVGTLLVLGGNPAYTAPADLDFAAALARVPTSIYLGLYEDETARTSTWFVPAAHWLESWGDARAYDGTASLVQPLIAPLRGGRTESEVLAALLGERADAHALLRESWSARLPGGGGGADEAWDDALRRGVVEGTALPPVAVRPSAAAAGPLLDRLAAAARVPAPGALEAVFVADSKVHDGRFANNAWLQELPAPMTKLTWDNAALLSPATAARIGLATGDVARLKLRGRELTAPVFVLPGHADDAVSLPLGYGRRGAAEATARGVGFDGYALRTAAAPYVDAGLEVEPTGERHALATTQTHWSLEGRDVVLAATLAEYRANPDFAATKRGPTLSLYEPYAYGGPNQWAMAIDLSLCTGCGACVMACQAENNVPVVGKQDVLRGREMHWLRLDRYFSADEGNPDIVVQPMLCQHCERAPCEYVCPVEATVHSPDGLNEMVYNRCVGTRFCSNNCPYKVRRFNWFDYSARMSESESMAMNPDVTVRERGVMEKCTFCVQRIRGAEIDAAVSGRVLGAGEVVTACQQACPTQAIAFGSLTSPTPELASRMADPRRYSALHELGTGARVRYLARISNPPEPEG